MCRRCARSATMGGPARVWKACGGRAPETPTSWTPCSRRPVGMQLWAKSVESSATSSANIGTPPRSSPRGSSEETPKRMATPGVGQDIEAMCGRCGQVWHVVMAKMGDRIAKVVCKRCGGHHRYRDENADTAAAQPPPAVTPPRVRGGPRSDRRADRRVSRAGRRRPARRRSIPPSRRAPTRRATATSPASASRIRRSASASSPARRARARSRSCLAAARACSRAPRRRRRWRARSPCRACPFPIARRRSDLVT